MKMRHKSRNNLNSFRKLTEVAIKYLEQDLIKLEQETGELLLEKEKADQEKPTDARIVMAYTKYFLEHLN